MDTVELRDRQVKLWKEWLASGSSQAHAGLVESLRGLVYKTASKYSSAPVPYEDLVAEGFVGALDGIDRFNPEKGHLSYIARPWIKRRIQEYLHRMSCSVYVPKSGVERKMLWHLSRKVQEYEQEGWSSERAVEFAARDLDVDPERARNSLAIRNGVSLNDDGAGFELTAEDVDLDESMTAPTRRQVLADAIARLDETKRSIVLARDVPEEPGLVKDLADEMGMSETHFRNLRRAALAEMRAYIESRGFEMGDLI